jgi:hypothetical protein
LIRYYYCITASGSNCHQLLAALGKRRKAPNLLWKSTISITKPLVEIHHFNHQTSRGNPPLQSPNFSWKSTISITKPLVEIHHFNHQTSCGNPPLQSPNLSWKSTTSITKTLVGFSHFKQSGNIGQHMAWDLFSLPASSADSTLLLHSQGQMDPHTPPHPLSMASSNTASWPRYGHLVITQAIRR